MVPSGRSILDPGWVQQNGAPPPWREGAPCLLLEPIEIGRVAAVRAVAGGLGQDFRGLTPRRKAAEDGVLS